MTLKEHMSGEAPNFTNHAGHETQMMRRETVPKILNTIINIFKFQERTSLSLINFVHKSRDLQCKKVEYSGSPSSPRFNAFMIDTIEDPQEELCLKHRRLLVLLKYPFYPMFILDNGMNLISKSLTILTSAQLLIVFTFAHIFWRYFVFAGFWPILEHEMTRPMIER